MVHQISTDVEFTSFVENGVTIVDFTATWCGPCKMISPVFEELSKKYTNVKFLKVDVDEFEETSSKAGVSAMPSFFVYKDGQIVEKLVGANKDKLEALVVKYN